MTHPIFPWRMIEAAIESVMTELEDEETVSDYEDLLLPTLEAIADERRMLFVYVDT